MPEILETIQKYSNTDVESVQLKEQLEYFSKLLPTIQDEWIMFPTEVGTDQFELMVFFKNENAVRRFRELAVASLGGPLISGVKFRNISRAGRDQLVNSLFELAYLKYTQFELPLRESETTKRLMRLRQVAARSSSSASLEKFTYRGELGSFRQALSVGDYERASEFLNLLKRGGLLSSINLCFLQYQLWFHTERDDLIWGDERIEDVIRCSRPRVVTEFLLVSLWRHCVIDFGKASVAGQDQIFLTQMKLLLKSVVMPTTPEGRCCLALVSSLSGDINSDLFTNLELSQDERELLNEIIETKKIPSRLLGSGDSTVHINAQADEFSVDPTEILAKAEQFRDEADVRSLLKLLSYVHERGESVDIVLKRLIRCVADENLPDFAVVTEEWISRLGVETASWSKGLQKSQQRVKKMASIYSGGWPGVFSLSKQEFIINRDVIVESGSSWHISVFEDSEFDTQFAQWITDQDPEIIQDPFLDNLLDRLRTGGIGETTVGAILDIRRVSIISNSKSQSEKIDYLLRLIRNGESENVEFKSSLRSPLQGESPDKELRRSLEFSCIKSVAAMLHNVGGGKLIIGVSDNGECIGLERDYESSEKIGNRDGFERHFRGLLQQKIEGLLPSEVRISFETVNNNEIAVVDCPPASSPKYVNHENRTFLFVRDGNATIDLVGNPQKFGAFISSRF